MMKWYLFGAGLCAAWLFPASITWAQRDQITPTSGASATGSIISVSATEVEIDVRGTPKRFAVNEIDRLSYGDEPADLRTGRTRALEGQFEEAVALLSRIPPESVTRELVKEDLLYYRAYAMAKLALTGGGDKAAAASAMLDFVKNHPKSFHYYEATELIGDLAYAMGRYDVASEYYSKLGQAPWPDYQMRAKVLDARSLMAQEKYAEAQKRYEEVAASPIENAAAARQKTLAQIGRATCLALLGKPDEGKQVVETIIRDNDPQDIELFANAYNALGLCELKANRPKEALLAFLHVDLLFSAQPEAHAEALYYLSQLWTTVGKSDRAVAARSLLKSRYAGSVWAAK